MRQRGAWRILDTMKCGCLRWACSSFGMAVTLNMKIIPALAVTALVLQGLGTMRVHAQAEGVALAVILDTSGSMKDPVRDASGQSAPKYVIANRALKTVAGQIQAFAAGASKEAPRTVHTSLFVFQRGQPREAIQFGPYEAAAFQRWAAQFTDPDGNTPLGNTLLAASRRVLASPLSRKHVLIITDGKNTFGPDPAVILPRVKKEAEEKGKSLGVHFIAFDVDAREFERVRKQGATVVGAADEAQLKSQLEFILQQKILLEDEEPVTKK